MCCFFLYLIDGQTDALCLSRRHQPIMSSAWIVYRSDNKLTSTRALVEACTSPLQFCTLDPLSCRLHSILGDRGKTRIEHRHYLATIRSRSACRAPSTIHSQLRQLPVSLRYRLSTRLLSLARDTIPKSCATRVSPFSRFFFLSSPTLFTHK